MAESSADLDGKVNVELIEISEQLEPLMQKKQSSLSQSLINYEDSSNKVDLPFQGATPAFCLSQSRVGGSQLSPTHTSELLAGGIPKNRKRPGSTGDCQRVTMRGIVTRGNSVGQPVEVQLELTETEYLRLTSREHNAKEEHRCEWGKTQGPHIIIWSIFCIPVAMVISVCISFYNGSMTWYNLVIYLSEEKSVLYKMTLCPVLILSFPITVALSALCLSVIASVMQVSWSWRRWWAEIWDGEKGFYGWFCSKVGLPKCSPYQVVILDDTNT